jgi:hypothetical protein
LDGSPAWRKNSVVSPSILSTEATSNAVRRARLIPGRSNRACDRGIELAGSVKVLRGWAQPKGHVVYASLATRSEPRNALGAGEGCLIRTRL